MAVSAFLSALSGSDGETKKRRKRGRKEHPEMKAVISPAYRRREGENSLLRARGVIFFPSWEPLAFWIMFCCYGAYYVC